MAHVIRNEQVTSKVQLPKIAPLSLVQAGKSPKTVAPLKLKPRVKIPCHRLPFVGRKSHEKTFSFWNVPLVGGYGDGCKTGSNLATFMLIHLREQSKEEITVTILGTVAMAWLEAAQTATSEEFDALQGQVVGFMTSLSPWLIEAADQFGGNLEKVDQKELLKRTNARLKDSCEREITQ